MLADYLSLESSFSHPRILTVLSSAIILTSLLGWLHWVSGSLSFVTFLVSWGLQSYPGLAFIALHTLSGVPCKVYNFYTLPNFMGFLEPYRKPPWCSQTLKIASLLWCMTTSYTSSWPSWTTALEALLHLQRWSWENTFSDGCFLVGCTAALPC